MSYPVDLKHSSLNISDAMHQCQLPVPLGHCVKPVTRNIRKKRRSDVGTSQVKTVNQDSFKEFACARCGTLLFYQFVYHYRSGKAILEAGSGRFVQDPRGRFARFHTTFWSGHVRKFLVSTHIKAKDNQRFVKTKDISNR